MTLDCLCKFSLLLLLFLQIAEDFKMTAEQAEKYGYSKELDTLTRKMCKKFTSLNITREEYLLLKSIILFNIGGYPVACHLG